MKLYVVAGSGNCRKVQATINKLNITADLEYRDLIEGELGKPDFISMNPNGRVPVLVDGDYTLWESNAIMQYLADTVPDNTLYSQNPQTRADINRWQCWELAHFNNALGMIVSETVFKPQFFQIEPDQAIIGSATESLDAFTRILEDHLVDRDYVVGNNITLADYSIINIEGFKDMIPFDWSRYPRVSAYFERLRADPHWASTAPESAEVIGRRPNAA
ncbi:Glutathione S-transferase [hydrothermal vent metagenome]|uniref:Glutathione S-transferase n=1 Tax=hydrothermal vent metagenome TaxID=652676 RepID=A0A3B0Y0X9_9ZZZZ